VAAAFCADRFCCECPILTAGEEAGADALAVGLEAIFDGLEVEATGANLTDDDTRLLEDEAAEAPAAAAV
jgi:hypothetical protein